jgi:hypothetical protein
LPLEPGESRFDWQLPVASSLSPPPPRVNSSGSAAPQAQPAASDYDSPTALIMRSFVVRSPRSATGSAAARCALSPPLGSCRRPSAFTVPPCAPPLSPRATSRPPLLRRLPLAAAVALPPAAAAHAEYVHSDASAAATDAHFQLLSSALLASSSPSLAAST